MQFTIRRRLLAAGFTMLLAAILNPVGSLPAHAAGADPTTCQWRWRDLPLPAGVSGADVEGTDGGTRFVGRAWKDGRGGYEGVVWENGRATLIGTAFGADTSPLAVNRSGVAVGYGSRPGPRPVPVPVPVPQWAVRAASPARERGGRRAGDQ